MTEEQQRALDSTVNTLLGMFDGFLVCVMHEEGITEEFAATDESREEMLSVMKYGSPEMIEEFDEPEPQEPTIFHHGSN